MHCHRQSGIKCTVTDSPVLSALPQSGIKCTVTDSPVLGTLSQSGFKCTATDSLVFPTVSRSGEAQTQNKQTNKPTRTKSDPQSRSFRSQPSLRQVIPSGGTDNGRESLKAAFRACVTLSIQARGDQLTWATDSER